MVLGGFISSSINLTWYMYQVRKGWGKTEGALWPQGGQHREGTRTHVTSAEIQRMTAGERLGNTFPHVIWQTAPCCSSRWATASNLFLRLFFLPCGSQESLRRLREGPTDPSGGCPREGSQVPTISRGWESGSDLPSA